jgi:hypothetical protein
MSARQDEALEVLRAVWRGRGQAAADLAEDGHGGKSCKRMTDVGFEDFAGGEGAGGERNRSTAWRAMLEREGKLRPDSASIKDLVLGSDESS